MNIYELFIFDFDGTIADSRFHIENSINLALLEKGLQKISSEKIYPTIGKLSIQEAFTEFYPKLSIKDINQLTDSFRNYLVINAKNDLILFPGVKETLIKLKKKNKVLVILTTKSTKSINEILDIFQLTS